MSLALTAIRRKALATLSIKEQQQKQQQQQQQQQQQEPQPRIQHASIQSLYIQHSSKPYICENMNLNCILQALNNYEGINRFKKQIKPEPTTIEDFCTLFNELNNNSYIFLKVMPAAMHLFGKNGWYTTIDCMDDNSIFVVKDTHIYNYIYFKNSWWIIDSQKKICDILSIMQLGMGADYCLIPVRHTCAKAFMETLKRWMPADPFYKTVQAGLIVSIYEQLGAAGSDIDDLYEQLDT